MNIESISSKKTQIIGTCVVADANGYRLEKQPIFDARYLVKEDGTFVPYQRGGIVIGSRRYERWPDEFGKVTYYIKLAKNFEVGNCNKGDLKIIQEWEGKKPTEDF